mgnify:CR=1 FL=1
MNIWSVILSPDFLFTSIRVMTPILFAAMACMVFVKGGIDPIGTEGIMLSCACGTCRRLLYPQRSGRR